MRFLLLVALVAFCASSAHAQQCGIYASCGTCNRASACQWCYRANSTGSTDGVCQSSTSFCSASYPLSVAYTSSCPNLYCGASFYDCSSCASSTSCYWCQKSTSTPGVQQGTCQFTGVCPMGTYTVSSATSCPQSQQQCGSYTSCGTCNLASACHWCYRANSTGSTDGVCQGSISVCPSSYPLQISYTSYCPSSYCNSYSSCSSCSSTSCYWCQQNSYTTSQGTCQSSSICPIGSYTVISFTSCPGYSWGWLGMSIGAAVFVIIILPIVVIVGVIVSIICCLRRRRYYPQHQVLITQAQPGYGAAYAVAPGYAPAAPGYPQAAQTYQPSPYAPQ